MDNHSHIELNSPPARQRNLSGSPVLFPPPPPSSILQEKMEQKKQIILLILSTLLLSFSAEATCVARNTTHHRHHHHRHRSASRRPSTQLPPHVSVPLKRDASPISLDPSAAILSLANAAVSVPLSTDLTGICGKTDYPSLCISSIAPYLTNENTPAEILGVAIEVTGGLNGVALAKANRLSADPSMAPRAKACAVDCKELYGDAADGFNKAAGGIRVRDLGLINSMLSGAITDYETCEDGYKEMGLDSPFKEWAAQLSHMTSNCLAIASLI